MKYMIGYYKNSLEGTYRVYVQEMNGYTYLEDFTMRGDTDINKVIDKLRVKYPDHDVCEFKY